MRKCKAGMRRTGPGRGSRPPRFWIGTGLLVRRGGTRNNSSSAHAARGLAPPPLVRMRPAGTYVYGVRSTAMKTTQYRMFVCCFPDARISLRILPHAFVPCKTENTGFELCPKYVDEHGTQFVEHSESFK
jgi:hypothetical protein